MGQSASDRARIARLGSAQSALIEAAEELRAAGEDQLAADVDTVGRKLNDIIAPIRAAGQNRQRWDNHA